MFTSMLYLYLFPRMSIASVLYRKFRIVADVLVYYFNVILALVNQQAENCIKEHYSFQFLLVSSLVFFFTILII